MEYKWTISALDCAVKDGKLSNVVQTIHWRYSATDADGNTSENYGAQSVPAPTSNDFVKFDNLTEADIVSWLEAVIDVDAMQESLQAQIQLIKNPIKVTLPPPYNE
jgi:hypothetical protein